MKLFYLILAHTNLHQVNRMINALKHDRSEFFIHVDGKVPINEIRKFKFHNTPGITVVRSRFKINWGGYNMIRATLSLMRAVCKKKETGYLILLSGQDFPIKSPAIIYNFLTKNYGHEYLEYFPLPDARWNLDNGLDRIRYQWFIDTMGEEKSMALYEFQKNKGMARPFFDELLPYGGAQWWCITAECATYILKFLRYNRLYEEYFEHCLIPDEIFFNTLVLNSPFKENTVNNNLKYIDWQNSPHPCILTMDDWQFIMQSESFWARKFVDSGEGSDVLDRLETHINEVRFQHKTFIP